MLILICLSRSYISELLGQPKPKENLADFLSSSSVLSLKLGRVDVRFHEPWSLREFIGQQLTRLDRPSTDINNKLSYTDRGRILRTFGYRVLSNINDVSVMMPTALVGTVLLTLRGRGVGKAELVRRLDWLCERVRAKGGRVAHFYRSPTETVVDRALEVLGPKLVGLVSGLAEPTYYAVDRFQLSFYRNMLIHLFITEALVSVAMYTKIKQGGGPANQRITYDALKKQVSFLSQLFRGEFIFPPEGLAQNFENTLRGLEKDDVIMITRDESGTPLYVELSESERLCGRENYDFYCFLIWPFIEASWLGSVSLLGLTPPLDGPSEVWIDMKKAQDSAQLVRFFSCHTVQFVAPNLSSSVKPCITKAISLTSKQSTKKHSRIPISGLRKKVSSWSRKIKKRGPVRLSSWLLNGYPSVTNALGKSWTAVDFGTLLN